MVPRVASVILCWGVPAPSTTAARDSAGRPAASTAVATEDTCPALSSRTLPPGEKAKARQSVGGCSSRGGRRSATVKTGQVEAAKGMPAHAGNAARLETPGHHLERDVIGLERQEMLRLPGGETEIMAVQPNDTTALGGAGAGQFAGERAGRVRSRGPGPRGLRPLGAPGATARGSPRRRARPPRRAAAVPAPRRVRKPTSPGPDTHVIDHAV